MADGADMLILPPPYREIRLAGAADPWDEARALAASAGAGTLVWSERPGVLALAVVLEPERPLAEAREAALLAGMSALAEAVAAVVPPERPLSIVWPDEIACDGARLGGGALIAPEAAAEAAVPDWLIFAAALLRDRDAADAPGLWPGSTSLTEEGVEPGGALIESFAAHLLRNFDTWEVRGRAALAARYLERLAPGGAAERLAEDAMSRQALDEALAERRWYDAGRRRPRW